MEAILIIAAGGVVFAVIGGFLTWRQAFGWWGLACLLGGAGVTLLALLTLAV